MISRLLIANRGEIAVRIARACHDLGIECVAAYTQVDRDQRYLHLVDDTICISQSSYLSMPALISAAKAKDCQAIHPGYGFLAENAEFADMVRNEGFVFIGPLSEHIRMLGDKSKARHMAASLGLKVIQGSDVLPDETSLSSVAGEIGLPILLKAAGGGGGTGMRVVERAEDLELNFRAARTEAMAAFADERIYAEKYLSDPRHVEVQVFGNQHGDVVHLGTRDCSVQRRYQKLIEEAPAPGLTEDQQTRVTNEALLLCREIGYQNAGTVEFLMHGNEFYFLEMNARIQVEHPVTEEITGLDLVKAQIQLAAGVPTNLDQKSVTFTGAAIECRIVAEEEDFRPSPGRVTALHFPGGPGIRIDSHLYEGTEIPHQYDSLIAKIIARGQSRGEALARMKRALSEFEIAGVQTNRQHLLKILDLKNFAAGRVHTGLLKH